MTTNKHINKEWQPVTCYPTHEQITKELDKRIKLLLLGVRNND